MAIFQRIGLLALIYTGVIAGGFLLFVALVRSPLLLNVSILFYRGILLAGISVMILLITGAFAVARCRMELTTLVGACAISLAFNICFLVVFPVTFDRSITIFLLAQIEKDDGTFDARSLERAYTRKYLGEMRQIDRRINEQQLSGNIAINKGKIQITPQGRQVLKGARIVGGWFNADPRFVGLPPEGPTAPSPH
ncbi:hypothetical protein BH11PSE5_BH11PSE5_16720 [soil metagenome]